MNYSIIGGSGFIGTALCKMFNDDDQARNSFVNIDKAISVDFPEKTRKADVRSKVDLQKAVVENSVVINLAAEHRDDVSPPTLYSDVNVTGAANICAVCEDKGVDKVVFISSVAVYGFAPADTSENGVVAPFNAYGKSKYEAEKVFSAWQRKAPEVRTLVIVRPTVVFGPGNRGNVYNLIHQIYRKRFLMVGDGRNRKSMAYVENLAAFIKHSIHLKPGVHVFNYVDKPDYSMGELVLLVRRSFGRSGIGSRLSLPVAIIIGKTCDLAAAITGRKFSVSEIRVRKFCAESTFATNVSAVGFTPPFQLEDALVNTIDSDFCQKL